MKISIITATWNSGKTVEDTLTSVQKQTYTDVEHIIKDGDSRDDTVAICEGYRLEVSRCARLGGTEGLEVSRCARLEDSDGLEVSRCARLDADARLEVSGLEVRGERLGGSRDARLGVSGERLEGRSMKIISGKDKGIYDAMNQGIEAATGDVIGILNSDDFFTSDDVLERVAREFEEDSELEALYGDIHFVDDADLTKCVRYYSSSYFRPWLLRFGFMPAHPSFYVRREVYEKYGLYDLQYRTSSDFEMMVRLFGKNRIKAKYIMKDFVTMRTGGESTAGMEAKRKVNNDIVAALKTHGIFTCPAFRYIRYGVKGVEVIVDRLGVRR